MLNKEDNIKIVRDILNIVYEQNNLDLLKNYIHDNATFQIAGNTFPVSSSDLIKMYSYVHFAYPNLKYEIIEQFENEGRVFTHYRLWNAQFSFFVMVLDYVVDSKIKKSIFTIDPIKASSVKKGEPSFDLLNVILQSSCMIEENAKFNIIDGQLPSENYLNSIVGKLSLWDRLGFLEDQKDLVVILDSKGELIYANNRITEMLGYSFEEVLGQSVFDFVYEEDIQMALEIFNQVISKEKYENYFEIRNKKNNGDVIWLGESLTVFGEDENLKIFLVARDITGRKNEDEALRQSYKDLDESEKKYRELIESMDLGLIEWDDNGIITNVNSKVCTSLEYGREELLSSQLIYLISANSMSQFKSRDSFKLYPAMSQELMELELVTKKEDSKWFLAHSNITEFEGNVKAGLILIDITERILLQRNLVKAREEAQRSRIAQDKYTANMSHEIRTPLSSIIGNVELLEEIKGLKEHNGILSDIKFASNHLISLLDDIMDLAKFEANEVGLKLEKISIVNIFNYLVSSFTKEKVKSVLLKYHIDDAIPDIIYGSKLHLTQVLLNLVGNAVKFTAKGEIFVTASIVKEEANELWLNFKVKDTGIGISSDSFQEIFLDFKQIRKDTKSNTGVGLGLPISKKLVEMLGGTLEVTSLPFKGSTFSFAIPFKKNMDHESQLSKDKSSSILSNIPIRVLILEDNILNVKYLARLFETLNLEFSVGFSGWEGMSLLQHRKFDIIFTDYRMPDMDGFEFTRKVRNSTNWYAEIPIIAFSASSEQEVRKFGFDAGITDFVRKPFKKQELLKVLNEYVRIKNSSTHLQFSKESIQFPLDFNSSIIHTLYDEDYEVMDSMFKTALTVIDDDVDLLNRCNSVGDYKGIQEMAHKLKSSFNFIGLDQIENKLSSIEKMVLTANTISLNAAMDQFNFLYQKSIGPIKLASIRIGNKLDALKDE
jgi:PAS domain S-box-containing protein